MRRYVWFHSARHGVYLMLPLQSDFYWQCREIFQSIMEICHVTDGSGVGDFIPIQESSLLLTVQHPGAQVLSHYNAFVVNIPDADDFADRVHGLANHPSEVLQLLIGLTDVYRDRFYLPQSAPPATESFINQLGG